MDLGTPPPSRSVVSGNQGMNMSLSELISWLLEPVANEWQGGFEVNSTDDFINKLETYNYDEKECKKNVPNDMNNYDEASTHVEEDSNTMNTTQDQGSINYKFDLDKTKKSYKKSHLATKKLIQYKTKILK